MRQRPGNPPAKLRSGDVAANFAHWVKGTSLYEDCQSSPRQSWAQQYDVMSSDADVYVAARWEDARELAYGQGRMGLTVRCATFACDIK